MTRSPHLPAIVLALAVATGAARAQLFDPQLVQAELVSEVRSIRAGEPFWVGIRMRMSPGWHVNWRNPGDAGLAPTVTWRLPDGFEAGEVQWPYPDRFDLPELRIFGYGGEVCLLVRIDPPHAAPQAVTLEARVEWLACREACVPGGADLALELPVRDTDPIRDEKWSRVFNSTRERFPVVPSDWRFEARLTERRIVLDLVPPPSWKTPLGSVVFFPTDEGVIENSAPQQLEQTDEAYRLVVERPRIGVAEPRRFKGVLVSEGGWGGAAKALEIDVPLDNDETGESRTPVTKPTGGQG